jgi:hypothetical protein
MTKKPWILLVVLVSLTVVYVFAFTNWLQHPSIQISHSAGSKLKRAVGARVKAANIATVIVNFGLDRSYRLTEIKVVRLAEWQTNKSSMVWHLISVSNSIPTRAFSYGQAIRGMKPVVAREQPKPLEPTVTYRLFLTAGSIKGQHDFSPPPK